MEKKSQEQLDLNAFAADKMREYIQDKCKHAMIWIKRDEAGKVRELMISDDLPGFDQLTWENHSLSDYLAVSKMLFVIGKKDIPVTIH